MAHRKIVYVIVEGPSDDEALGYIISKLYDRNLVHVKITYGDITSNKSVLPNNIIGKVGDLVKEYAKSNHFKNTDFYEVIHLIDMDGAYAPDSCVLEDSNSIKPYYTTTEIYTANPHNIIERNKRKRDNINQLCHNKTVWKIIPYRAYYMSSNLDHVLYDKLNSNDDDKENDAFCFAKKYKNHIGDFLDFISDSEFSVCTEFKESWEFIKLDKHSLERHSNLGICFQDMRLQYKNKE